MSSTTAINTTTALVPAPLPEISSSAQPHIVHLPRGPLLEIFAWALFEKEKERSTLQGINGTCRRFRTILSYEPDSLLGHFYYTLLGNVSSIPSYKFFITDTPASTQGLYYFSHAVRLEKLLATNLPCDTVQKDLETLRQAITTTVQTVRPKFTISSPVLPFLHTEIDTLSPLKLSHLSIQNLTCLPALPPALSKLEGLVSLSLRNNLELKELFPQVSALSRLERLEVFANPHLSRIPSTIGKLSRLQELRLAHSYIQGSWSSSKCLPPEIGNLSELEILAIDHNRLVDKIPTTIGNLIKLRTAYFSSNCLTSLPEEISLCKNIVWLDLSGNRFEEIPSAVFQLTALKSLNLALNAIQEISPQIGKLTLLEILMLRKNELYDLPPEIGSCTQLSELHLEWNHMKALPVQMERLSCLEKINLSYNKSGIEIPKAISDLPQLTTLRVSPQMLELLPDAVKQLPSLEVLDENEEIESPFLDAEGNLSSETLSRMENFDTVTTSWFDSVKHQESSS